MQARIDALQHTLLMVGEEVYRQAQQPGMADEYAYDTPTQAAPWANGNGAAEAVTPMAESYEEFIDDETITADYEAVD